jgi:hypothetical protein
MTSGQNCLGQVFAMKDTDSGVDEPRIPGVIRAEVILNAALAALGLSSSRWTATGHRMPNVFRTSLANPVAMPAGDTRKGGGFSLLLMAIQHSQQSACQRIHQCPDPAGIRCLAGLFSQRTAIQA